MWTEGAAVFATFNLPGSNNDQVPWTNVTPAQAAQQPVEVSNRTTADIAWIYRTFTTAFAQGAKGVVLLFQADMWDAAEPDLSGYDAMVQRVGGLAQSFAGPVLLLEGDSHVFRVDHPFTPGDPLYGRHPLGGISAPNVTRIVVKGSTNPTEYLRLTVDPAADQLFSWQPAPI